MLSLVTLIAEVASDDPDAKQEYHVRGMRGMACCTNESVVAGEMQPVIRRNLKLRRGLHTRGVWKALMAARMAHRAKLFDVHDEVSIADAAMRTMTRCTVALPIRVMDEPRNPLRA
jgi:hypothetical protein